MRFSYSTLRECGASRLDAFRIAHPVLYMIVMVSIGFLGAEAFKAMVK